MQALSYVLEKDNIIKSGQKPHVKGIIIIIICILLYKSRTELLGG